MQGKQEALKSLPGVALPSNPIPSPHHLFNYTELPSSSRIFWPPCLWTCPPPAWKALAPSLPGKLLPCLHESAQMPPPREASSEVPSPTSSGSPLGCQYLLWAPAVIDTFQVPPPVTQLQHLLLHSPGQGLPPLSFHLCVPGPRTRLGTAWVSTSDY